tara:strand:- start:1509 stop:1979 length:471 start_codon:yes stop_codon:yes gene_type:complete
MTVKAKPILENKFWIVEEEGIRIGTLSKEEEGFVVASKGTVSRYKSENALKRKLGKNLFVATLPANTTNEKEVHGYPTRSEPFNSMYDIKEKLPIFTKSKKSKSLYCAGYYLVKFNINWLKSYCPKLITLQRNKYLGPYKTEIEMKAALSNANRTP